MAVDLGKITFNYKSWLYEPVGLVFKDPYGDVHQFLSPKRGNETYTRRVLNRFIPIEMYLENYNYGYGKTQFMFITLTYNRKGLSLVESWTKRLGHDFNLFWMKFKRIFGKTEMLRCFEAHSAGYPHIHLLVRINELIPYFIRNKKYRVDSDILVKMVKTMWSHKKQSFGFVDIQACINGHYAAEYILKYILKMSPKDNSDKSKSLLNYALLWNFHKRAYSVSKILKEAVARSDLIRGLLPNSNLSPWEFLGINTKSGFIDKKFFHLKMKLRKFPTEYMTHSVFIQKFKISAKLLYPWWSSGCVS